MDLFYSPEYAKTGDVIPYYNEETKRFEGYYLKNWNPDAPKDMVVYGWHHIVSEDNRNFYGNAHQHSRRDRFHSESERTVSHVLLHV